MQLFDQTTSMNRSHGAHRSSRNAMRRALALLLIALLLCAPLTSLAEELESELQSSTAPTEIVSEPSSQPDSAPASEDSSSESADDASVPEPPAGGSADDSSDESNGETKDEPGNEPGDETGNEPGNETGNEPGDETGNEPGDETGGADTVPVESIVLAHNELTLRLGGSSELTASILPENATQELTWSSSDETVATFADGHVQAVGIGTAEIICSASDDVKAVCLVTVLSPAVTDIVPQKASLILGLNESAYVSNWTLLPEGAQAKAAYSTSSNKIAAVDANGKVTAKKIGKAVITIRTDAGPSCTVQVEVRKAPASVKLSASRTTLAVGETENVKVALSSKSAGAVIFRSSNPDVATISDSGVITAVGPGKCAVAVKTYNGKTASMNLTVAPAPTEVAFPLEALSVCAGEKGTVAAKVNAGSAGAIAYQSSDETVATVNASTGAVVTLAEGVTTITATTYNGLTASYVLTVLPAPTALRLIAPSAAMGLKEKMALSCSIDPIDAVCGISYSTSNAKIATVDPNGVVTAKKTGTVTITAKTYNGVKASVKIAVQKAPTKISVSCGRRELGVGESAKIAVSLPKGTAGAYVLTSSNPDAVSLDGAGNLLAVAPGQSVIEVKTYNGKKASVTVTVVPAPTEVAFPLEALSVCAGEKGTVAAKVNAGSAGEIAYQSSDETVATVNASTGAVVTLAEGVTTITATTYNGLTASYVLTVLPAPTALRLIAPSAAMGLKEKMALSCSIDPIDAVCGISYSTSNAKIATVDQNGVVTAKKIGTVTITAKTYNGVKASVKIAVQKAPTKISVSCGRRELGVGESAKIAVSLPKGTAGAYALTSSNPDVVSLDGAGNLLAVAPGQSTIEAVTYNGKRASVILTVKPEPTSVSAPASMTLGAGQTALLAATVNAESAGQIFYTSNDENVVSVDALSGKLIARGAGTATILCEAYNGVQATTEVTVLAAPTRVSLGASSIKIGLGDIIQLNPTVDEGAYASYTYATSNKKIAAVNASGMVKAVSTGSCTITVKTYNGKTAKLKVTVVKAPTALTLSKNSIVLMVGETQQISAKITSGTATTLSTSVSDETVASIDASGVITGLAPGVAVITVSTHNGKKATCTVFVMLPPDRVTLKVPEKICVSQCAYITAELPEYTYSELTYSIVEGTAATITSKGFLYAREEGTVTVHVSTSLADVWDEKTIQILPASESEFCLIMPERRTDVNSISENLALIECVEFSAYKNIDIQYLNGSISRAEYEKRMSIVKNAFAMYKFPWMTPSTQKYWRAANSENGAKDFQPGIVYYGLPYTQTRRTYNVEKALKEDRYIDSGAGYYVLNKKNLSGGTYCGNDCSAFVSMAIWGTGSGHSDDTTSAIAKASVYKKISYNDLRSGDILNKSSAHVVMFLYWTDETKTQMVIIEQGGGEPAINTCSTSIRPTDYYKEKGYTPLRLTSLG